MTGVYACWLNRMQKSEIIYSGTKIAHAPGWMTIRSVFIRLIRIVCVAFVPAYGASELALIRKNHLPRIHHPAVDDERVGKRAPNAVAVRV